MQVSFLVIVPGHCWILTSAIPTATRRIALETAERFRNPPVIGHSISSRVEEEWLTENMQVILVAVPSYCWHGLSSVVGQRHRLVDCILLEALMAVAAKYEGCGAAK